MTTHLCDKPRQSQLYQLDLFGQAKIVTAIPYIREAISEQVALLSALEEEMRAYSGPETDAGEAQRLAYIEQWPRRSVRIEGEDMRAAIDTLIDSEFSFEQQFRNKFNAKFMSVALPLLIHSATLVEATINTVQQVGLIRVNRSEMYEGFDKLDVISKWTLGPALFESNYRLDKSKSHYSDLVKESLINAFGSAAMAA